MQYQMNEFLFSMILTELEDAVGKENCSTRAIDKVTHSVDYYWLSRMWADRGLRMPEADGLQRDRQRYGQYPHQFFFAGRRNPLIYYR